MKFFPALFIGLFCGAGTVLAQAPSASLTPSSAGYSAAGGTLNFTVNLAYSGEVSTIGFELTAPSEWTFGAVGGSNPPGIAPRAGDTGNFGFSYITVPASPISFTFSLTYPSGLSGSKTLTNIRASFRPVGGSLQNIDLANIIFTPNPSGSTAPSITTQPANINSAIGTSVIVSVTATGTAPLSYQWRKDGTEIQGATNATLTLQGLVANSGSYTVVISNAAGSVTSNAAQVRITDPTSPVTITTQPASRSVAAGATVTLSVGLSGPGPFTYQWFKNGTALTGASAADLVLASVTATTAGDYFVEVTSGATRLRSAIATISVNSTNPATAPLISVQPAAQNATVGHTIAFTVVATGNPAPTYQWRKNGAPIAGATSATFSLSSASIMDAGSYDVVVSNAAGTVTSSAAQLTLTAANSAPVISMQPAAQIVRTGGSASFAVVATGIPAPTYQWRKDGTAIPGATAATLVFPLVLATDSGGYDVVVNNPEGSAISSLAQLTLAAADVAPVITRQPESLILATGLAATFNVAATGAPAPTYQWRKDGVSIPGATTATLGRGNIASTDAGAYSVVVSNPAGSVTSVAATLTVLPVIYAGAYFGSLSNGGICALHVAGDNTGAFLGFTPATRTSYVSRGVTIDVNGRFRFSATPGPANASAGLASAEAPATTLVQSHLTAPPRAAAVEDIVIEGTISSDGSVSGASVSGGALSLSAARSDAAGTAVAPAGFYQAGAAGKSAQLLAIVGASGRAFALVQSDGGPDAGMGMLSGLTTSGQQSIVLHVAVDTSVLTAVVTDASHFSSSTYAGFADGAAALAGQRIINMSTRTTAGTGDQVAIVGFVVDGTESKTVLVRAIGPTLRGFGVTTAVAAPTLELRRDTELVGANAGWTTAADSSALAAAAARAGAFALGATSADSALLVTLAPGRYTAVVGTADGRAGASLIEVYDLSGASKAQKLVNLSTRAIAGAGDNTLIAGVVVSGTAPKRVLIRGAGPALAQFGLSNVLARPQLTLFAGESVVAQNAGWSISADAAAIAEASNRVGAFAFPVGSADAALLLNLAPGAYTAQLTGTTTATGLALIEVYEVP